MRKVSLAVPVVKAVVSSEAAVGMASTYDPEAGVCQLADVLFIAVSTCPAEGAVAAETDTVVDALFNDRASTLLVVPEIVLLVSVSEAASVASVAVTAGTVMT